jgi:flagellin-like protein
MKNFRRSKKALSPVVASIILIAVTVAVSIAVAAWMGALTIGFMDTEEVRITNANFDMVNDIATVTVKNTGSTSVTIAEAYVGTAGGALDPVEEIPAGQSVTIDIAGSYDPGVSYQFKVVSTKGNPFVYTATAPT